MKKEIADKWVAALRSGDYKQVHAYLHTPAGYCCLGVLCEITKEEIGATWTFPLDADSYYFVDEPDARLTQYQLLPYSVANFAGCVDSYVIVTEKQLLDVFPDRPLPRRGLAVYPDALYDLQYSLASLNDSGLYSFEDIAKIIETYWEEL